MIRAYTFLMRPTAGRRAALGEMLRDHCSLCNGASQERRDAYRHVSRTSVKYGQQSGRLKGIRAFDPERQGRWSFSSQQATLRRLDQAFAAFFRRIKAGGRPGYPRFRGVNWFDTVDFPKDGDGCRWDSTPHDPVILTASNGVHVVNPRHARKAAAKLEAAQRALSRFPRRKAKDRTRNHQRAVDKVAALHGKVRRQRLDHAHKTALDRVGEHGVIAHEDLKIRTMSKTPAPEPDPGQPGAFPPNGAAARTGLNRSIADAGWGCSS